MLLHTGYARRILPGSALSMDVIRLYQENRGIKAFASPLAILELLGDAAEKDESIASVARAALKCLCTHCSDGSGTPVRVVPYFPQQVALLVRRSDVPEENGQIDQALELAHPICGVNGVLPKTLRQRCRKVKGEYSATVRDILATLSGVARRIDPLIRRWKPFSGQVTEDLRAVEALSRPEALRVFVMHTLDRLKNMPGASAANIEGDADGVIAQCGDALEAWLRYVHAILRERSTSRAPQMRLLAGSQAIFSAGLSAEGFDGCMVLVTGESGLLKAAQTVASDAPVVDVKDYITALTVKLR
jgi:hypothetical protein